MCLTKKKKKTKSLGKEMVQKTEDPVEILEQDLKSKTETLHDDKNNR